jgi:hypothetical protein
MENDSDFPAGGAGAAWPPDDPAAAGPGPGLPGDSDSGPGPPWYPLPAVAGARPASGAAAAAAAAASGGRGRRGPNTPRAVEGGPPALRRPLLPPIRSGGPAG